MVKHTLNQVVWPPAETPSRYFRESKIWSTFTKWWKGCYKKILEKSHIVEKDDEIRVKREFDILFQFNHPNVILLAEIIESEDSFYSGLEFYEEGVLFNLYSYFWNIYIYKLIIYSFKFIIIL